MVEEPEYAADRDTAHPYLREALIPYDEQPLLLRGQVAAIYPVDYFLPAACDDYIRNQNPAGVHGQPFAAVADPVDQDNRSVLPFGGGAFAAPGEDHLFGTKAPSHRKAL